MTTLPDIDFDKQGGGSQQMRTFRRTLRDTGCVATACKASGHTLEEAKLLIEMDKRNPPKPEDFEPIPVPGAPTSPQAEAKESGMATKPKSEHEDNGSISGEYERPDAAKAFKIFRDQIAPKLAVIDTKRGECSQPWSDIKEHAHFPRPVMNFLLMLDGIDDDQKQEHYLLALAGGLRELNLFMPRDLVTIANGEEDAPIVPTGERKRPFLAAVDGKPSETDPEDGFEASEEELAAQKGRPSTEQAQAEADAATEAKPGTGAAARAAMKSGDAKTDA